MSIKSYTRSFAGGEMSPHLLGRMDLAKFQTGLAKCLNFEVTPQGPVQNRAGFEYVIKAKFSAKKCVLIPFSFNSTQTFALEVGDQYVRFHTQGATLLEAAKNITGITQANPGVFTSAAHGFANGQWVFLAAIGGMTALNSRWAIVANATADTFTLTDLYGAAISTAALPAYTAGGTASRVYEIATSYLEADLFDLHYVQSADVLTITHPSYPVNELRRLAATNWTLTAVSFLPTIATPAAPNLVALGPGGGSPTPKSYVITAIQSSTLEESLPSPAAALSVDMTVAGNGIEVQVTAAVTGAVRYNFYKLSNGLYGYIGQTDGSVLDDFNITPDMTRTPPLAADPLTGADLRPWAVTYFEQRRCFGGSNSLPQTMWLTRSGTEQNMSYSIPSQDDDAITARIVAREANYVRHLVPLNDLLAMTSGGIWKISAANSDALTPATFSARPQGYVGASGAQPAVTSNSVLYAQDRGGHVRELAYQWQSQSYQAQDISVLAAHLFDFLTIKQMAYAKSPVQTLWAVRDDGILLGLTHLPEEDVRAWHQHGTQGLFESVAAVAEGSEDGVYVIVNRTINGQTVRYVERRHTRQFATLADAFFVDAGAAYSGAPVSTISGLHHLEGMTVSILADGGVSPAQVVTNGAVTLDASASTVQVGLAYNSDLQTLPLAYEVAGFGQGETKNINQLWLRVNRSSGVNAGPSFDKLRPYVQRSVTTDYGVPPDLVTDVVQINLDNKWGQNGDLCVRQSDPLPLEVLSMTLETATGG